ncbi:MAG: alpha/beta hydrolase [Deltaproteobacteria bacterium]|nr:alpha/beta hydrolase [Deltaproteobacteria bacterium]
MPNANVNGLDLYYEVHGEGEPLILIRGFGSNADHWYAQVPAFSTKYRTITFDNRGMARSDASEGAYTISMMAADTAGLMDAIGISAAHVLGLSMGGMIAQSLAIEYPGKVRALILACTHCGGHHAVQASDEVREKLAKYAFSAAPEMAVDAMTVLFAEKTLDESPELGREYVNVSRRFRPTPDILMAQLEAVQGHDAWAQLPDIQAPTLVLTGKEDILIPPENAEILAERIPNARLEVIEGGGHQFLIEQPEAFNRAVLDFLTRLDESTKDA